MKTKGRGAALLAVLAILAVSRGFAASLPQEIDRLIASSSAARTAFWGIQIVDLASGRNLYELNPDHFFVPASNTKLFTTALALTRLGPDFTFQTRVLAEAAPDGEGRIRGSLVLAGGGDPNLSGRTLPYRMGSPAGNPLAALEDLADQVAARGVKRVEGGIVGDDTFYLWEPYAEGWSIDDPQYDYGAPVSALTLNDNTLSLVVRPAAHPGSLAELELYPPLEYYRIDNRIRTTPVGGPRAIRFERDPGGMQLRLWGSIPLRDRPENLLLGIEDPALYAARAFRQALEARGIAVGGAATARHLFPGDDPSALAGVELARRVSAPLLDDLRVTDKVSQNLHAELALRAVGRARRNVGSREAGLQELQEFLEEAGVDRASYNINDGSGLARLNLVTPAAIVQLLRFMYASPARDNWISLLPVGGQDGTLSARFGDAAAAGRIYAKTGTLAHVSALSGYARRTDGSWAAFSILVNNYNAHGSDVRGVMDRICTLIVE